MTTILENGIKTEAQKSTKANPMTNLDPGWSDALMNDLMTSAFPIVPDTNMNVQKINFDTSFTSYGRRKESGQGIGDGFKSEIQQITM